MAARAVAIAVAVVPPLNRPATAHKGLPAELPFVQDVPVGGGDALPSGLMLMFVVPLAAGVELPAEPVMALKTAPSVCACVESKEL
jgi:hypothetical protein